MSVMKSVIPHGRPFTVDDLEAMPDDGNRYELIDGTSRRRITSASACRTTGSSIRRARVR